MAASSAQEPDSKNSTRYQDLAMGFVSILAWAAAASPLPRRLHRPRRAKVRSTARRRRMTTKPFIQGVRRTLSRSTWVLSLARSTRRPPGAASDIIGSATAHWLFVRSLGQARRLRRGAGVRLASGTPTSHEAQSNSQRNPPSRTPSKGDQSSTPPWLR